jgi:uncharacterized protein
VRPAASLAALVTRRPWWVIGAALLVLVVLAVGLPRLVFETTQEGLIGEGHPLAATNAEFQEEFGGEALLLVLSAHEGHRIDDLFTGENRRQLIDLEDRLRATDRFHAVLGPVGSLELGLRQFTVGPDILAAASARIDDEVDDRSERLRLQSLLEARIAGAAERASAALAAGAEQGLDDPVSLDNPAMVSFLLYEDDANSRTRAILRGAFPDTEHALLVARFPGNLPLDDAAAGIAVFEEVVADVELEGFDVLATGGPMLIRDINDYLRTGAVTLGLLSALVMAVVLFVVFRVRWRMLSMVIVVLGAVWGFGLMGFVGIPLTLLTISGLPILVGVGVDFSIQVHSRFEEELTVDGSPEAASSRVLHRLAPPLGVAMLAAVAGFLSLQVSDVPQIRQFGLMLAIGIAALFAAGTLVPLAILALRERHAPAAAESSHLAAGALERAVRFACFSCQRHVVPVAMVGFVIIGAGLAVEGRFTIQTDPERWIDQSSETVHDLQALRSVTGYSSELVILVEADDVTETSVLQWVDRFARTQVTRHPDVLAPGSSAAAVVANITGAPPGQEETLVFLGGAVDDPPTFDVASEDFVRSFVSTDLRRAAILFPIRNIPLQERQALLDEMRADLDPPPGASAAVREMAPPPGAWAEPTGLAAIGSEFVTMLEANRVAMTWLALAAVGFWLLAAYRNLMMALLPLVPVAIAVGLSSLVTLASGRELSPLTSVTGPLVIATCTEFSVLILARFVEERRRGLDVVSAIDRGAVRIGRAFVASGLTTVGGFGVLALSSYPLLSDFGILVSLNVLVALVSALVVLPPLLMWADRSTAISSFPPPPRALAESDPPPHTSSPA